jgi:hypothetical protein
MTAITDDVTDATRLVVLGMRPRQIPARDLVYADLVRRYTEDDDFADIVTAVANGLEVRVLAVTQATGAVLAAREESLFEMRIDEYAKRAILQGRGAEKVIHGLAHIAIAALAFPRPDDLANDTYVGRVSVEQVDGVVREACRILDEQAIAAEQNHDPLDTAPDLERAWRAYMRRPEAAATKDGRLAPDSTRGMITKAAKFLVEQGFLIAINTEGGGTYRTTPRYQVQVRDLAATTAYQELLALGAITVTAPSGSLYTVADPASAPVADAETAPGEPEAGPDV